MKHLDAQDHVDKNYVEKIAPMIETRRFAWALLSFFLFAQSFVAALTEAQPALSSNIFLAPIALLPFYGILFTAYRAYWKHPQVAVFRENKSGYVYEWQDSTAAHHRQIFRDLLAVHVPLLVSVPLSALLVFYIPVFRRVDVASVVISAVYVGIAAFTLLMARRATQHLHRMNNTHLKDGEAAASEDNQARRLLRTQPFLASLSLKAVAVCTAVERIAEASSKVDFSKNSFVRENISPAIRDEIRNGLNSCLRVGNYTDITPTLQAIYTAFVAEDSELVPPREPLTLDLLRPYVRSGSVLMWLDRWKRERVADVNGYPAVAFSLVALVDRLRANGARISPELDDVYLRLKKSFEKRNEERAISLITEIKDRLTYSGHFEGAFVLQRADTISTSFAPHRMAFEGYMKSEALYVIGANQVAAEVRREKASGVELGSNFESVYNGYINPDRVRLDTWRARVRDDDSRYFLWMMYDSYQNRANPDYDKVIRAVPNVGRRRQHIENIRQALERFRQEGHPLGQTASLIERDFLVNTEWSEAPARTSKNGSRRVEIKDVVPLLDPTENKVFDLLQSGVKADPSELLKRARNGALTRETVVAALSGFAGKFAQSIEGKLIGPKMQMVRDALIKGGFLLLAYVFAPLPVDPHLQTASLGGTLGVLLLIGMALSARSNDDSEEPEAGDYEPQAATAKGFFNDDNKLAIKPVQIKLELVKEHPHSTRYVRLSGLISLAGDLVKVASLKKLLKKEGYVVDPEDSDIYRYVGNILLALTAGYVLYVTATHLSLAQFGMMLGMAALGMVHFSQDDRRDEGFDEGDVIEHYSTYNSFSRASSSKAYKEWVLKEILMALPPKASILSVGAGDGSLEIQLQQLGFRVTALELQPQLVAVMKQKGIINAIWGNVKDIPTDGFPGSPYDLILYSDSIGSIGFNSIKKLQLILKPTGSFLIADHTYNAGDAILLHVLGYPVRRFMVDELISFFAELGFRTVREINNTGLADDALPRQNKSMTIVRANRLGDATSDVKIAIVGAMALTALAMFAVIYQPSFAFFWIAFFVVIGVVVMSVVSALINPRDPQPRAVRVKKSDVEILKAEDLSPEKYLPIPLENPVRGPLDRIGDSLKKPGD
jgi:hypothetical protein